MSGNHHPLLANTTELGYDELERRHQDIVKRMNQLRGMGYSPSHEMMSQLQLILDSLESEKSERLIVKSNKPESEDSVWIDTEPLPEELEQRRKQKPSQNSSRSSFVL
jgi:hypothetical protein